MVVLIGLIVASGLLLGPRPSEAVVNTCSVNGIYNLNGYGQNNTPDRRYGDVYSARHMYVSRNLYQQHHLQE